MLILKWNSYIGIVGMRTNVIIGDKVVCIGDGVEFRTLKGKTLKGVVVISGTKVGVMYDTFVCLNFKSLDDIEILRVVQEHTELVVSRFNMVVGHRVEVFKLEGLAELKY